MSSSEVYHEPDLVPTDETVALSIPDPLNPALLVRGRQAPQRGHGRELRTPHFERVTIVRPHNVYGIDMGAEHVIPQFVARMKGLQSHPTESDSVPDPGHRAANAVVRVRR